MDAKNDGRDFNAFPACMFCRNLINAGDQVSETGWTCAAFPDGIPYNFAGMPQEPHVEVTLDQLGEFVYDPFFFTEEETGRLWHYNADKTWGYHDGEVPPPEAIIGDD